VLNDAVAVRGPGQTATRPRSDEDAVRILRRVREAMEPTARLLVIDGVVGPPNEDPQTKFLDMMMLVSAGGRERTTAEWHAVLAEAGFRIEDILPAGPGRSVIAAVRACSA
jgi:hypothetical protein